ncbi:MAG: PEP-CTERM sorting domain-containing protein [Candidatus Rokubacteria bacterium]|nr:PEP-CTERM sorting domain-containing protein [Candidatus Rokubacteria bacterium]
MVSEGSVADLKAKAQALLEGTLKHARAAALTAALVPLGSVAVTPAEAGVPPPAYSSRVDATVTQPGGPGTPFLYGFTVVNTTPSGAGPPTPLIVDWELPIFAASDVFDITSPSGWNAEVIADPTNPATMTDFYNNPSGAYGQYNWNYDPATDPLLAADPGLYGPNPGAFENPPFIIHWVTNPDFIESPIFPDDSLSGFGFMSDFGGTNAPYLTSWFFLPPVGGDPPIPGQQQFAFPNSSAFQATQGVPEPASLLLMAAGAGILLLRRRGGT